MAGTLAFSTGNSFPISPENSSFTSKTTRSNRQMSFAPRTPCKSRIRSYTETATPVMDRRRSAATSLYEMLRVNQNASPMEIKTAYRTLAKVYHPDASESDGRDFIEIHKAYATLSDPAARAMYDLSLGAGNVRSFGGYASASNRSSFYSTTRRWETDQCW